MTETIILAGGCFWCTEAIFSQLKGVIKVIPGYSGGKTTNPSYGDVCSGKTGHAESVQITFDSKIVSLKNILYVFFKLHDPTQMNRQGADIGTQYRSAVFYRSEEQKKEAEEIKSKIPGAVTEVTKYKNFYPADAKHKDYYFKHRNSPYCTLVIDPKIKKLREEYKYLV